jgi:hypothetical protein
MSMKVESATQVQSELLASAGDSADVLLLLQWCSVMVLSSVALFLHRFVSANIG